MSLEEKFATFETHRTNIRNAEEVIKSELAECSKIIKSISEEISPRKNLTYKGRKLTIVCRQETYFFRGLDDKKSGEDIVVG